MSQQHAIKDDEEQPIIRPTLTARQMAVAAITQNKEHMKLAPVRVQALAGDLYDLVKAAFSSRVFLNYYKKDATIKIEAPSARDRLNLAGHPELVEFLRKYQIRESYGRLNSLIYHIPYTI